VTFVSPGFRRIVGLSEEDDLNSIETFFHMIVPDDRGEFLASLNKSGREGSHWDCEFEAIDAQGVRKWLRVSATPEAADGSIFWHGYLTDCSLRKQHELEIQQLAYKLAYVARCLIGKYTPISQIRCSFYGDLKRYDKWFIAPISSALCDNFDPQQAPEEANSFLQERGINYESRSVDERKRYGNAMTIDLETGSNKVSLRGTIAENTLMITRIDDFNRVYLVPQGNILIVEYPDRPGVLACITAFCAEAGINIEDIHAPRNTEENSAIAILLTDKLVPGCIVDKIKAAVRPSKAVSISIP